MDTVHRHDCFYGRTLGGVVVFSALIRRIRDTWSICRHNCIWLLAALVLAIPNLPAAAPEKTSADSVQALVDWLLSEGTNIDGIYFRDVVRAATGRKVLPVDPEHPADQSLLQALDKAVLQMIQALDDPEHPVHGVGRINEVSGHLEDVLLEKLDAMDGFRCDYPPTADGRIQRSGYPDLRLEHLESGRVFYVDPKVYRQGSENSSFRTFYYEPKVDTNKITENASHIIIGLPHIGRVEDRWRLTGWRLVDLHNLKIRLKAEFQASNRDMYGDSMTLRQITLDE